MNGCGSSVAVFYFNSRVVFDFASDRDCAYGEGLTFLIFFHPQIDNLVKGASGQALQNMNIMMGAPETCGLLQQPMFP